MSRAGLRRFAVGHERPLEALASAGLVTFFALAVWIGSNTRRPAPPPQASVGAGAVETFENGTGGWIPYPESSLVRTTAEHRGGRSSSLARATSRPPKPFGAYTLVRIAPARGSRWSFVAWVKGDTTTAGKLVRLQLVEAGGRAPFRTFAAAGARVSTRWQRVETRGTVSGTGRAGILAYVLVPRDIGFGDAIYLDDAVVSDVSTSRPARSSSRRTPSK